MVRREIAHFHSVAEGADALGVCDRTVRRHIETGDLKAHRIGRQLRISTEDYKSYVALRRG